MYRLIDRARNTLKSVGGSQNTNGTKKKKTTCVSTYHYARQIIIITLFQEDNIFGTNASLTYGLQFTKVDK